jgi:threonyl-tRNA synthetase
MPVKQKSIEEQQLDDLRYRIRHSAAHVMAEAVLGLFPEAKFAVGPPIDGGFYYDFSVPRPFTPEDLEAIETAMRATVAKDVPFEQRELTRDEAKAQFAAQPFKIELIDAIPVDESITTYTHSAFSDLCRGPHVPSTGALPAFKLMNVAGAYWRGSEENEMLQRIYGTAWESQEALDAHLERLEEAKKRDHRKLGKELGLFVFSDDVGSGLPMFTPKGEMIRHTMETYVRETQTRYGYEHVWTGNVVKEELYRRSGHLENYAQVMFPAMVDEDVRFRLKPMNCPSHMMLYREMGIHSYREIPLRFAEFATLYRYEKQGEIMGLTRVRALTQDDCHVFCTPDQIESEFSLALQLIREVLGAYHFDDFYVQLSLRGDTGKYVEDSEKWDLATKALISALDNNGVEYTPVEGEAAFYGPKADFMAHDILGREWQLSTIQVDFIQPSRLGLEYIGEDGQPHTPVLLHRAVTGSTERFLGVLIEHYSGAFPAWLAPVQAEVIPIADRHIEYAETVRASLVAAGLRAHVDDRNERMGAKIRDAQMNKVPYMLVVGDKEAEAGGAAVRLRSGDDLGIVPLADITSRIAEEVVTKA